MDMALAEMERFGADTKCQISEQMRASQFEYDCKRNQCADAHSLQLRPIKKSELPSSD